MSITNTEATQAVALYDTTTGLAFGPTFLTGELAKDYLAFAAKWTGIKWADDSTVQAMSAAEHAECHDAWFDARVDPETGQLRTREGLRDEVDRIAEAREKYPDDPNIIEAGSAEEHNATVAYLNRRGIA